MSDLPHRIREGVTALQERRWEDAVRTLEPVAHDADLRGADDLQDVRARVLSLLAQATLEAGQIHAADAACREALRVLRRVGDKAGVAEVRGLQDRVVAALAEAAEAARRRAEQAEVAAAPLGPYLAEARTPVERAERLVKKATACADVGDEAQGLPLAEEALALARADGAVTWEVFARVALARLAPDRAQEHLHAAATLAARSAEFNLVSVIVEACRLLNVSLPTHPGAHVEPQDHSA